MLISMNWLKRYVELDKSVEELSELLTMAGLEVAAVDELGAGIGDVVVARIEEKGQHPNADRLSLCKVTDGTDTYDIVCGATNMVAGDHVALARVGAVLPGNFKIKKAKLRGVESFGMMCSYRELGLGEDHSGIIILPRDTELGTALINVLGLPDTVIEVEITPNRPDWLSVVGVAREVAALTGAKLALPAPEIVEGGEPASSQTSVTIEAPELCPRYAARLITGVKIAPSPLWMQQALQRAGVRPISNVVDVTNYVLMELGHPLHAFDFNKLRGGRIVVKRAGDGEKFTTLDGEERVMSADDLMIADGEGAVAVAGVMGGQNSEVSEDTVDVLLESAYFNPSAIRLTSKKLGLKTEASYRFERGADVDGLVLALERAASLIAELAGGMVQKGRIDEYPSRIEPRKVSVRTAKASAVLGIEVTADETRHFLEGLGLETIDEAEGHLTFKVPAFRVDIEREIDLIEEIARVKGYHTIPATLPKIAMDAAGDTGPSTADKVRNVLASAGLREAITLSFIDPEDDERLMLAESSPLRRKVVVQNPLGKETSVMRTSLLPGLLKVAGLNSRRMVKDVAVFEVGRTFHPDEKSELPDEINRVCAVVTGSRSPLAWWAGNERMGFYDAKGLLETLLTRFGVHDVEFCADDDIEWLQPGRAATVSVGGKMLGWIGELHPDLLDHFELTGPVAAFQLEMAPIAEAGAEPGRFPGLIRFPAAERDLAFMADRAVTVGQIIGAIESLEIKNLTNVVLFDAFEGGKLPEGKQSLAFRLTYQDAERTLTEEEITENQNRIVAHLAQALGAHLRDV